MSDSWRPQQSAQERLHRSVLSMVPGSVGGRIAQATFSPAKSRQQEGTEGTIDAIFSYSSEPVADDESPPYYNWNALADMGTVMVATRSNPDTDSTLSVMVNGDSVMTITLGAGQKKAEEIIEDVTLGYGDLISVKFTSVATNLKGVTIHVLLEV